MAVDPPVSALLSQLLVAFTIEFDNEFEHQMPHRTPRGPAAGSCRGPWLVSMAMWAMLSDPAAALPHYPMVLHRGGFPDGS
jgi:hypothetical protein